MKKIFTTLGLLLLGLGRLYASNEYAECPDFTDLTASYVEPYASGEGKTLVNGRHTVITEQGTDPRTGNMLRLLPDGVDKVIRLGDELAGSQKESLTYHVKPKIGATMFMVKFAVVFENPDHITREQPYFSITTTDSNGNLLPNTFSYAVYAQDSLPNFKEYIQGNSRVLWQDWTDGIIDLSRYIGQDVYITFYTRDCLQNGHYAYAYFTASCLPRVYANMFCNNELILSLIEGFSSYLWSDGSTSKDFQGNLDQPVWCDVTSIVGLITRIFMFHANNSSPMPDITYDDVCEGTDYFWNGIKIDTKYKGTRSFYGEEYNEDSCSLSEKMLILTTIPTYYEFNETICEGDNYIKNGFKYINPPVGVIKDTVEVKSDNECKRWNVLNLNVVPKSISPQIDGEESPCTGVEKTYKVLGGYNCKWTIPSDASHEYSNDLTRSFVTTKFNNDKETTLSVVCDNGCVSKTVTKVIHPVQTIRTYKIDTVCQGTEYKKGEWNLGVQNKLGYTTHIRQLGDSCNSTDVLVLYVTESPSAKIIGDSVSCQGRQINLFTVGDYSSEGDKYIAIGDVWCEDGSVMRLKDFLKSGKVAKGIVYEVFPEKTAGNYRCSILDIKDAFNGDAVEYDPSTMDASNDLPDYLPYLFYPRWQLLNEMLAKIEGADLLSGKYWGKLKDYSGQEDTHRLVYGENHEYNKMDYNRKRIKGLGHSFEPMTEKNKVRYHYEIILSLQ